MHLTTFDVYDYFDPHNKALTFTQLTVLFTDDDTNKQYQASIRLLPKSQPIEVASSLRKLADEIKQIKI